MSFKLLLAEDSLTIQKVVQITLANEPFEITYAKDFAQYQIELAKNSFDLVLIDFGLQEDMSGYELAKLAKTIQPKTKTVLLMGTFDNVDEESLKNYGVDSFINKPFDGQKFINLCLDLVADRHDLQAKDEFFTLSEDKTEMLSLGDKENLWEMSSHEIQLEDSNEELSDFKLPHNPIGDDLSDWGINFKDAHETEEEELPPFIHETSVKTTSDFIDPISLDIEQKPTQEDRTLPSFSIGDNQLKSLIEEKLEKTLEKVAWEVIPDLAENIIRQELQKIINEIKNKSS